MMRSGDENGPMTPTMDRNLEIDAKLPPFRSSARLENDPGDVEAGTHGKVAPLSSPATGDVVGTVKATPFSSSAIVVVENNSKAPPFFSPETPCSGADAGALETNAKMRACSSSTTIDAIEGGGVVVAVAVGVVIDEGKIGVEELCRICHLRSEVELGGNEWEEMIQIGCDCKGELGCAHRHCAETWFQVKGNRYCEICGGNAKNINGEGYMSFMDAWHDTQMARTTTWNRCWSGHTCCNYLVACLVISFVIAWFFRVNIF